jgi:photosystem II stability/assembly factor-like uncharacterized protein
MPCSTRGTSSAARTGAEPGTHLATFDVIYSVLVHPAAPNTLYVGAYVMQGNGYGNLFKSSDGGATWTRTPASIYYDAFNVLVGSPTDPDLVYAGAAGRLYRTDDGGATWRQTGDLTGAISSLVVNPHEPSNLYAATDGDGGYYYPFGAFAESTNTGGNWTYNAGLGSVLNHVSVAMDAANPSTLFVGLAASAIGAERGVRRSDDGGATWARAEQGLPEGAQVETIAVDPVNASTVYAGTRQGIYRSRDSGETWLPFSQMLGHVAFSSIVPSFDGRSLLAVTDRGAFGFDVAEGPIDVAATGNGAERRPELERGPAFGADPGRLRGLVGHALRGSRRRLAGRRRRFVGRREDARPVASRRRADRQSRSSGRAAANRPRSSRRAAGCRSTSRWRRTARPGSWPATPRERCSSAPPTWRRTSGRRTGRRAIGPRSRWPTRRTDVRGSCGAARTGARRSRFTAGEA